MLELEIPGREVYREDEECFVTLEPVKLRLEHSLVSLSKWEAKWKKPFLDPKSKKTYEESVDYIRCMTLTQNVDPLVYKSLPKDIVEKINDYINDSSTATTFSNHKPSSPNREVFTSEVIYHLMFAYGISIECQKWHLNRLMTLIRIFDVKASGNKKMGRSEILAQNRALNEARRKAAKSRG